MSWYDNLKDLIPTIAPPPKLKISEWADRYRILSPESSPEPGQWMTERVEYLRGIMDAVTEPTISDLVLMCNAQGGKTEGLLNNVVGYYIDQDPSPIMVVQPTIEMGQAWSKDRFSPMVRDTQVLRDKVRDQSRDGSNTILHKVFPGGNLTISGANSPASLAQRPKRIVIMDDVDRFPASAGEEGDPVLLAFKRTQTFWNKKRILISTPTDIRTSRIYQAFIDTDQRYYYVPCIKCGEYQVLEWDDPVTGKYYIKWEKDKNGNHQPGTARYECRYCGELLTDANLLWMVRRGEWRATATFNGKAGFAFNELYSPWTTMAEIVRSFLEARKRPETLKVWVNTSRGKVFEDRGDAPEWQRIFMRREGYEIGTIPSGGLLVVAGADVQKDRIEVEVVAYGRGRQSWSVNNLIFTGEVASGKPFEDLDKLLMEVIPHGNGGGSMIRMLAIDSGYDTQTVYNWARKYPMSRVIATKGMGTLGVILGTPKAVDVKFDGQKQHRGIKFWPIGVSVMKSELYGLLRIEKRDDGSFPDGYCHFPEYDDEFFKQLTAEELKVINRRFEWKKIRERNEALDCRVYARAAAAALGMDRFKDEHWKILEDEIKASAKNSAVTPVLRKSKRRVLSRGIKM